MKIVLVADWLDKYGGAERVISSLCKIFKFQKCYALIDLMEEKNRLLLFAGRDITVQETNLKYFGHRFRFLFMFFYQFLSELKIDKEADVIISSSHAVAKGIRKSQKSQLHISYFQARNQKYLWSDYELYFKKVRWAIDIIKPNLRKQDTNAAKNPDYIVVNSIFVKEWVKKIYNRESIVIYPPVDLSNFPLCLVKEDYYVAVGRIEPYKRFDIIVKAFNENGKKLIIVGDGTQLNFLKRIAKENISFTGFVNSDEVYNYISKAKGFIHAGIEDFGIAPIEAQSCGTPVIALGYGGVLETIINNKTGIFFMEKSMDSLISIINEFESLEFNYKEINKNARRFDESIFEAKMKEFVEEKWKAHKDNIA